MNRKQIDDLSFQIGNLSFTIGNLSFQIGNLLKKLLNSMQFITLWAFFLMNFLLLSTLLAYLMSSAVKIIHFSSFHCFVAVAIAKRIQFLPIKCYFPSIFCHWTEAHNCNSDRSIDTKYSYKKNSHSRWLTQSHLQRIQKWNFINFDSIGMPQNRRHTNRKIQLSHTAFILFIARPERWHFCFKRRFCCLL